MSRASMNEVGRGVVGWSVLAGALAGAAAGAVSYFRLGVMAPGPASGALFFLAAFAGVYAFLVERRDRVRPLLAALAVAALAAGPAYWMSLAAGDPLGRKSTLPAAAWFGAAAPLGAYLLIALVKAYGLRHGADEDDPGAADAAFFMHALTIPLVLAASALLLLPAAAALGIGAMAAGDRAAAAIGIAAPYAWAAGPVLGALAGFMIGVLRGRGAALGALRFLAVWASRWATPVIAAVSMALIGVAATSGPWAAFRGPSPTAALIAWVALIWLAFNGVRQSGHGGPPPVWLRAPTALTLLAAPIFAYFAYQGLGVRVDAYGLTPMRLMALGAVGIAALHAAAAVASVIGEALSRDDLWMPATSKMNAGLAAITAVALLAAGTPLIDPWRISARNQEQRLLSGAVSAEDFDYGYLRFELGEAGDAALQRLRAAANHPEAATIRANVAMVSRFEDPFTYKAYREGAIPLPEPAFDEPTRASDADPGAAAETVEDLPLSASPQE